MLKKKLKAEILALSVHESVVCTLVSNSGALWSHCREKGKYDAIIGLQPIDDLIGLQPIDDLIYNFFVILNLLIQKVSI